jgi:DNA repair exonuclease SbcCD ATPase subunit
MTLYSSHISQCLTKQKQIVSKIESNKKEIIRLEAVKEPAIGMAETLLNEQKLAILSQIELKEIEIAAGDPYGEMHHELVNDKDESQKKAGDIRADITVKEAKIPYYSYWIKGFGDNGIRSFIIDGIIPALNTRINYWLQFLIDNQIKLTFNNDLDETIETNPPDGDPFVYNGLSGGEHVRIDLAISQAFAHMLMLSAKTCPSLVCLDETSTNLDRNGIYAVYNMIVELSRDRQVIVITHDQELLNMLEGADTITVEKKNGFSTATITSL